MPILDKFTLEVNSFEPLFNKYKGEDIIMVFYSPCIDYDFTSSVNNWTLRHGAYVKFMPSTPPPYVTIRLDKKRMDKALAAKSVRMPRGLTKEQRHQFLLNRANQLKNA